MEYQKELDFAKTIAIKAGDIMLQYFDGDQNTEIKKDGTPVTIADKTINRMVIEELRRDFSGDGVVGEEESNAEYGMGRRWICDPVDGTMAYTYGLPISMFSLALVIDGVPTLGVAYNPFMKQMFWGIKGQGSFCNGKALSVSSLDINSGIVAIPPNMTRVFDQAPDIAKLLAYKPQLAVFDGAVHRSCLVANGRLVGFPHPEVKPHDVAAVHVIIEEAGGKITDVLGGKLDYSKPFVGAILSNGVAHEQLLSLFV